MKGKTSESGRNMRVVTVQDLSCFGKCALTLALPVLSAMGQETSVLPTALLSTHTGGLGKPFVQDLTGAAQGILTHWAQTQLRFDAVLTGYLGSVAAMDAARRVMREFVCEGGVTLCDPAMADNGRLYGGLDESYACAMTQLCLEADVMLPNLTEAAMMTGISIKNQETDQESVVRMLEKLRSMGARCVVLKGYPGVGQSILHPDGHISFVPAQPVEGHYHGTGDLFAAAMCGEYLRSGNLDESARLAGAFVKESIVCTQQAGQDERMGVRFEEALWMISRPAREEGLE